MEYWSFGVMGRNSEPGLHHSRHSITPITARFARLVSEEWSQRRNDGHKSGSHEVFDHCNETMRDEFAICPGPADCEVVAAEILLRSERIRFDSVTEVLIHVSPQDGFTQSTRAAVNQHDELLPAESKFLELVGLENLLDR